MIRSIAKKPLAITVISLCIAVASYGASARADDALSGPQVYSLALSAMRKVTMPRSMTYDLSYVVHNITLSLNCATDGKHAFLGSTVSIAKNERSNTGQVTYDSTSGLGDLSLQGKPFLTCAPFPFAPEIRALVQTGADANVNPALSSPEAENGPLDLMKVIGSVRTFASTAYRIENVGAEDVGGTPAIHLRLTPLDGNQDAHPVTDLYVDPQTYLIRSVVMGGGKRGFFLGGGGSARFEFSPVLGSWLITKISIEASGHLLLMREAGTLEYTLHDFSFGVGS